MKTENTKPTKTFYPFGKKEPVEVRLFGRNGGNTDWNISALGNTLPAPGSPMPEIYDKVASVAYDAKVYLIFAPRPTEFNARVVNSTYLNVAHAPDHDLHVEDELFPWRGSVGILRGQNADGCDVPQGTAFWLSSADCPAIIAWDPNGRLVCAHAGLNSLIDRELAINGKKSRPHNSVVDAIIEELSCSYPARLKVAIYCGISAEHFEHPWGHPQYGPENMGICKCLLVGNPDAVIHPHSAGKIDLAAVIKHQFMRHGVSRENLVRDTIDTFSDKDASGEHLWWSSRRAGKEEKTKRNGILVMHR